MKDTKLTAGVQMTGYYVLFLMALLLLLTSSVTTENTATSYLNMHVLDCVYLEISIIRADEKTLYTLSAQKIVGSTHCTVCRYFPSLHTRVYLLSTRM